MTTTFIISASKRDAFPKLGLPEFAFVGRSNVGKSSLLNGLAGARVARTSKTPGRTQLINFFTVESKAAKFALADLPGYGYARAPAAERARWKKLVESYLDDREALTAVLWLLDLRRELTDEDAAFHEALKQALAGRGAHVLVVGTKCDKLSKAALKPALHRIAARLNLPKEDVLATSATHRTGLDALRLRITELSGKRRC